MWEKEVLNGWQGFRHDIWNVLAIRYILSFLDEKSRLIFFYNIHFVQSKTQSWANFIGLSRSSNVLFSAEVVRELLGSSSMNEIIIIHIIQCKEIGINYWRDPNLYVKLPFQLKRKSNRSNSNYICHLQKSKPKQQQPQHTQKQNKLKKKPKNQKHHHLILYLTVKLNN